MFLHHQQDVENQHYSIKIGLPRHQGIRMMAYIDMLERYLHALNN